MRETLRGTEGYLVGQVRDEPRAHCWDREWRDGSENNPKAGTDETFRNFIVARDTGGALGPGTKRTASWETQETPDTYTTEPPVHEDPTDDQSSSSSDSSSSSSSTQALSGIPQHAHTQAKAQTTSRGQK